MAIFYVLCIKGSQTSQAFVALLSLYRDNRMELLFKVALPLFSKFNIDSFWRTQFFKFLSIFYFSRNLILQIFSESTKSTIFSFRQNILR